MIQQKSGFFVMYAVVGSVLSFVIAALCLRLMNRLSFVQSKLSVGLVAHCSREKMDFGDIPAQLIVFQCGSGQFLLMAPAFKYCCNTQEGRTIYASA
ncbi:MAG: hypothetical protein QG632_283 [Candidatus Dependentiae bacterium]|nr:hypothetical protein [Candidatus Dependentiae bacterium]